jgi:hypothetical protein
MFSIKKFTIRTCDKKLATICIPFTIRLKEKIFFFCRKISLQSHHTEKISLSMFKDKIFHYKYSLNQFHHSVLNNQIVGKKRTFKIEINNISNFYHKIFINSMKWYVFITTWYTIFFIFSYTKLSKIF